MDDEQTEQVIQQIKKHGKLHEVLKVQTFTGLTENGTRVRVKIFDIGPSGGANRYKVKASTVGDLKQVATGDTAASIDLALAQVHWDDLH
jgi:hypothetical protein